MRYLLAIALATTVALSGCGDGKENDMDLQQRAEQRAVETRANLDDLVDRLGGTDVEVMEDGFEDCDPQDSDSGLLHNYALRFTVEPGAADLLQGQVASDLEADGWTVRRDAPNGDLTSVRFLRDAASMGAKVSASGNATAGGSGGCVS